MPCVKFTRCPEGQQSADAQLFTLVIFVRILPSLRVARILIIDDNVSVLQTLDSYLRNEGHTVIQAESGPLGLRLAAEQRPDLVMLDVEMPRMSGFAACEAIRNDPALRTLPVLMMTARFTQDAVTRGETCGASVVMEKPFKFDQLSATIATLLAAAG